MDVVNVELEKKVLVFDHHRCRLSISPWNPTDAGVELWMEVPYVQEDGTNGAIWKVFNERLTYDDGQILELDDDGEIEIDLSAVEGTSVCMCMKLPAGWNVVHGNAPGDDDGPDQTDGDA